MKRMWLVAWFLACLGIQGCTGLRPSESTQARLSPSESVAVLRPLAAKGDSVAQYRLAQAYFAGRGVKKDFAEGMKWLRAAATRGYPVAEFEIGKYYADDKKDYREAARWMRKAADHGNVAAQVAYGWFRFDGLGVRKSFRDAVFWLAKAAQQGNPIARYVLIFVYSEGIATKPSAFKAAYWYTGKRISDPAQAAYLVGKFYSEGFFAGKNEIVALKWKLRHEGLKQHEIRRYIHQVDRRRWVDYSWAVRWYADSAKAGFAGAQVNLAGIYENPNSWFWNCRKALKWTRAAANQGDTDALANMGILYSLGPERRYVGLGARLRDTSAGISVVSVKRNGPAQRGGLRPGDRIIDVDGVDARGLRLTDFNIDLRRKKGKRMILAVVRKGRKRAVSIIVVPQEMALKCPGAEATNLHRGPVEAVKWFRRAADKGNLTGLFYLAKAYEDGSGVSRNYSKAMALYRQAAERGSWRAAQAISRMYVAGAGVDKSRRLADQWRDKAIQLRRESERRASN